MIQVRRFDRKKESLNKIKYRSKGAPTVGSQSKSKSYKIETSLCGQIQIPPTGAQEIFFQSYILNPQVSQIIERISEEHPEEFGNYEEALKRSCMLKFRDYLYETVYEYNRRGDFVRIFPCKGSKPYERFFCGAFGTRMLNRLVHKALFSSEVLLYEKMMKGKDKVEANQKINKISDPKNLKYDIEDVPQEENYEHYKNKATMVRQNTKPKDKDEQKETNLTSNHTANNRSVNHSDDEEIPVKKEFEEEKKQSISKLSKSKSPVNNSRTFEAARLNDRK